MELLHAATLLHDDVLDNAALRRGKPAAHKTYGTTRAILAGDAMLALGNAIVASFGDPALCACFSEATSQTAAGEILEIDNLAKPDLSFNEYIAIATGKTGNLLAQSCKLGAIAAKASEADTFAAFKYGINLGIAFQIIDDCMDFSSSDITGKPIGGDLKERKMTPPIFLFRQSLSENKKREFDSLFSGIDISCEAITCYIKKISQFSQKARELAQPFIDQSLAALSTLPDTPERKILNLILETAINRQN